MKIDQKRKGWQLTIDILKSRRSVFPSSFTDQPIDEHDLHLILEASNWAPTHKLTQPWRFIVLTKGSKERLAQFLTRHYLENTPNHLVLPKKLQKMSENPIRSAAIIAICMKRDAAERVPEWEELAATACAVQNLWLAATALGLGGYWSTPAVITDMNAFLHLENDEKCLGLFYLGHHEEPTDLPNRSPWQDKVRWIGD